MRPAVHCTRAAPPFGVILSFGLPNQEPLYL